MRFTTYERIEESPLRVIKKNGERVRFDRDRILHGMLRACEKLPVSMVDIEEAVMRVEGRCQGEYDREVPSSVIGSLVMDELRQLDQVAYVRFASVYREFKDVGQFMSELETILDEDVEGLDVSGLPASEGGATRSSEAAAAPVDPGLPPDSGDGS